MDSDSLVPIVIVASYLGFLVWDAVRPARAYPRVRRWRLKGFLFFVLYFVVSSALPLVWDAWFAKHRLFDARGLGVAGGAVLAILVYQLLAYWWHRTMHRTPLLWRWFHQMHHSAERVDVSGAFYFHPLDMVGFTLIGSLAGVLVVGVRPEAAVIAAAVQGFLGVFQHANVRTPRWLGYLVQRPEGHAVHHQRGVHAWNYGDIALFDQLFGTWQNPATVDAAAGFYDGASSELVPLLLGRDLVAARETAARAPAENAA